MGIRKKLNELLGLTDSVKEEKSRYGHTQKAQRTPWFD